MRTVLLILACILPYGIAKDSFEWHGAGNDYKDALTQSGVVRGRIRKTKLGEYVAFLGIPYAEPPVGVFRFRVPLPPPKWKGVYDANRSVKCAQRGEGTEDCLIVNVFTPTRIINGPLPVLVYIHGGSFLIGSAPTQGVEPLIKENIIVVTVNYRLGVFGFLCLGTDAAPGNSGLKDQVAALKWVHDNIEHFGGNPNQVTLYGMSAGGASVEYQVLSSTGKGLFHQAIVESASATSVWAVDADPVGTAKKMAKTLNFPENNTLKRLVEIYRKVPTEVLSNANYDYYITLTDGTFGFVPCVERPLNYTDLQTTFITESPKNILSKGKYEDVPIMFVFSTLEGLFLRSEEYYKLNYRDRMESKFVEFMPADLVFDTSEIGNAITQAVKEFYFGTAPISDDTLIEYLNYFGDYLIIHGLLNSVVSHSRHGKPVYLMEFSYKGKMGSQEKFYDHLNKAGHGDVAKHVILQRHVEEKQDRIIVNRVAKLLGNFIKFGNPTPERSELIPILWPVVRADNVSCLQLDVQLQVIEEPNWGRKMFWDQLYANFRRDVKAVPTSNHSPKKVL